MTKLLAYHGKPEIKDFYKSRMDKHIKMDELIKGTYFEEGKGCFVGCTLHSSNHDDFEKELGIPVEIARISDTIFEGLSVEESKKFSSEFHDQIKVGADLSMVWPKFSLAILNDKEKGCINFAEEGKDRDFVQGVIELYLEWVRTGIKPSLERWKVYAYASASAYAYASVSAYAYASAYASAYVSASAYAYVSAYASASASASAYAYAYAYASARKDFWLWAKDKLFTLLRESK